MKLKFIDYPKEISISDYETLTEKIVEKMLANDAVLSLYQMGSIKHPGISDLDIICVFKNNSKCLDNFRGNLNFNEKNILTHGIFGIEHVDLKTAMSFNLISNLKYLGGKDLGFNKTIIFNKQIKKQIALEYLIKMLITLEAQIKFKIVKIRAFLLLAKAIEFDLQLLNIKDGKLYELVQKVIQFRIDWFSKKLDNKEIADLVLNFNLELKFFLEKELLISRLKLPYNSIKLPGNFKIVKHTNLEIIHKGFVLPTFFSPIGKKYINLQNRFNSFEFRVPYDILEENSIHDNRFKFFKRMVKKNKLNFPFFIPLTSSLPIHG